MALAPLYFEVKRGVRQGDPLSPYLFILCVEILGLLIRSKQSIKGVQIENKEIKVSQFADDTTLFLQDLESAKNVFDLLDSFGNLSGLRVNTNKSEAVWLGASKNNKETPLGIKWPKSIKILGIYFSHDKKLKEMLNFGKLVPSMKNIISLWKLSDLTIYGRITIIKSLLLSKLTYKASVIPVPDSLIKEISKVVHNFLWKGPGKVQRQVISGDFRYGGLRMQNIENMVKASQLSWLSRILRNEHCTWKELLDISMKNVGGSNLFLYCNYDKKMIDNLNIPDWYKNVFSVFLTDVRLNTRYSPKPEILWNNKTIIIEGNPVFYNDFYKLGIKYISDLFIKDNALDSFSVWEKRDYPAGQG